MNLSISALRRPITILVVVIGIALASGLALTRMSVDIFPNLNLPVIYVAQPYGGMDPSQMESYLVSYYEYHFLYVTGIEHVESRSIQNLGLVGLFFHPGTDMSQALAQVVSYVERSRAFMPPGTVAPFVVRYDAGSVAVGQLVFASETRNLGEIQDLALVRVRPYFSTLPGVSAPPPFGGNQRTVIIRVDPDKLREYQMSPEEVIQAIASAHTIVPAHRPGGQYPHRRAHPSCSDQLGRIEHSRARQLADPHGQRADDFRPRRWQCRERLGHIGRLRPLQ